MDTAPGVLLASKSGPPHIEVVFLCFLLRTYLRSSLAFELTSCVTVGSGDFVRRHGQAADSKRFCLEEKGREAVREQQALAPEPLFLLVGF